MNRPADPAGTDSVVPGQLRWRCRRGMKELDVLLERYLERDLSSATRDEISLFAEFLELQDPELARYLLAGEPAPDPRLAALVARIRSP
jgi:antitoxin CptB